MLNKFKELIERSFNIWCMKRWQKYIEKELELHHKYSDKSTRYKNKATHHLEVAKILYKEYSEKYNKERED